jgi:hypothetical protein
MYDFRTLSPLDFEELVRDLLQAELGVRLESFSPGPDQGIDLRFAAGEGAVLQAKHYVLSGFAALLRACRSENAKVAALRPARYLVATSVPLSPKQKSRIREAMPAAPLVEADIFGQSDLDNLLGRHPQIERKHFKLWLSSTSVLERILHSGVYNRTETEMGLIKAMVSRFVNNGSVPAAEAILAKSGALIVAGEPGVGKTTLARMLVWLHAEQGWSISVIDDIREAFELPLGETKRLIFFDDFLGQVALSSDLVRGMDQRFPPFLQKVRTHDNVRFVLTTRDYILRQAQAWSGRLASPAVGASEFILDVGHYTRSVRAKILYNHLYFSEMAKADLRSLLAGDFFLKIIDHRNFNPRLVELLTSPDYLAIAKKPIRAVVDAVLDNPNELWERPYRTQLGREARALMLSLFFNGPTTALGELEQTFARMLHATGSDVPASERPAAFRRTLKELEGSVLAIQDRRVRFSNPGVRDFLDRAIEEDRFLPAAVSVLSEYDELKQCWNAFSRSGLPVPIPPGFAAVWSDAAGRMIEGGSGSALDRLALVVESYEAVRAPSLLEHVDAAISDVDDADTDEGEVARCCAIAEQSAETTLPRAQAEGMRGVAYGLAARMLKDFGGTVPLDEVVSLADALLSIAIDASAAKAVVHEAMSAQVDQIDSVLDGIDSIEDLDDFEDDLRRVMRKYDYSDRRAERDIEYRRDAILEGRVRLFRPGYGSVDRSEEEEDASDEEIRSMFRGLPR